MNTQKEPGIALEHIVLLKSNVEFQLSNQDAEWEYNLCLTDLQRLKSEDESNLDIFASFDVMHGIKKPKFKFTCSFVAHYIKKDGKGLDLKDFTSAMALAHIIPYLREYISNITNRLPAPVLILAPINTYAMIQEYEERKRRSTEKKIDEKNES